MQPHTAAGFKHRLLFVNMRGNWERSKAWNPPTHLPDAVPGMHSMTPHCWPELALYAARLNQPRHQRAKQQLLDPGASRRSGEALPGQEPHKQSVVGLELKGGGRLQFEGMISRKKKPKTKAAKIK